MITTYPLANTTAQNYAVTHPGVTMNAVEKVVLHTTEGSGWPGYQGGFEAPTLTALPNMVPKVVSWREHFPINMSSRALVHATGRPATNTDGAVQVELVGTCVKGGPGLYWPGAPDWALQAVADFLGWMHTEWGLVLATVPRWLPYPASYGASSVRLTDPAYDSFRGIIGHQHVPQNDHGDPGDLPVAKILSMIGDDMPSSDDLITAFMNYVPAGQELNVKTLLTRTYSQGNLNTVLINGLGKQVSNIPDAVVKAVIGALTGTGPGGTITVPDVEAALRNVLINGIGK